MIKYKFIKYSFSLLQKPKSDIKEFLPYLASKLLNAKNSFLIIDGKTDKI